MLEKQIDLYLQDYLGINSATRVLFISTFPRSGLLERVIDRSAELSLSSHYRGSTEVDPTNFVELFSHYDVIAFVSEKSSIHPKETRAALKTLGSDRIKAYRTFDFSEDLFENCFNVPKSELKRINDTLIHQLQSTSEIFVRSDRGTQLSIKVDPRFLIINSCGDYEDFYPGTLPPAEIATCSDLVEGIMVVDGSINGNFRIFGDIRLGNNPLTVKFSKDEIVDISCPNLLIEEQVRNFLQLENARKIGEIGIGTNYGHRGFINTNSHINERYPSLHIGMGAHNQNPSKLNWRCTKHLDLILGDCEVFFDDRLVLAQGRFLLDHIDPGEQGFRGDTFMDVF